MYIPKRKVVCAMITEIDFKVKGEERKKLAYAIGELLGDVGKIHQNTQV